MATEVHLPLLDRVRIASPCPVKWEEMTGDDKVRHCSLCNLSVFNLSGMTGEEAEAVLQQKIDNPEQRLCAGFYRRADGTVLVKDCPVGFRAARARIAGIARRIAAAIGVVAFGGYAAAESQDNGQSPFAWSIRLRDLQPFRMAAEWLNPNQFRGGFTPGMVCLPPLPPSSTSNAPAAGNTAISD